MMLRPEKSLFILLLLLRQHFRKMSGFMRSEAS